MILDGKFEKVDKRQPMEWSQNPKCCSEMLNQFLFLRGPSDFRTNEWLFNNKTVWDNSKTFYRVYKSWTARKTSLNSSLGAMIYLRVKLLPIIDIFKIRIVLPRSKFEIAWHSLTQLINCCDSKGGGAASTNISHSCKVKNTVRVWE